MFEENMSKIDEIFKTAMDSHSEPYNPQAWESLSKRLDGGIPPRKNPFLKWGLPTIVAVIGVTSVLYLTTRNTSVPATSSKNGNPKETVATQQQNNTSEEHPETKEQRNSQNPAQAKTEVGVEDSGSETNYPIERSMDHVIHDDEAKVHEEKVPELVKTNADKLDNTPIPSKQPKPTEAYVAVALPTCDNVAQEVKNLNSFSITVKSNSESIPINPSEQIKLKLSEGNYEVIKTEDGTSLQSHNVSSVGSCEIVISELYFQDGLPFRRASIKTESSVISMSADGLPVVCCNKEQDILAFHKGNYMLNVGLMQEHGCTGTKEESIYVSDDYNLLAVNAFEPLSQDLRKSTFLPYALTQRNTPFKMIILDPSDGGIVFETSDVQLPWDGTDKRTGKMADTNKAYVWKVNLTKPEPGEKMDYMGTVVRM
jgi:hypothetical protein